MTIKFSPSTSVFTFIGALARAAVNTLVEVKLFVRTKQVCPEWILALKEMLQNCTMRLPHNRVTVMKHSFGNAIQ